MIINFVSNSLKFSDAGSKIVINVKMLENQTLSSSNMEMQRFTNRLRKMPSKRAISQQNVNGFTSQMNLVKSKFLLKSNLQRKSDEASEEDLDISDD